MTHHYQPAPTTVMNGLPVFEFQVAGSHSSSNSNLLRGEFGRVLKPYKVKAASPLRTSSPDQTQPNKEVHNAENENFDRHEVVCPDERAFYELCIREEAPLRQLRAFLPAFYGDTTVCTAGRPTRYLVLEDLTAQCGLPCVADLKMGVSRHYPGKPPRKLCADKEKYPSLRDTGWCIAGLLQHAPHGALLDKFGPSTGRTFSTQQVHARLTSFIGGARGSVKRSQLVCEITSVLEGIQKWFDSQRQFWFRSSSILVVYNAEYFCEAPIENSGSYSQSEVGTQNTVPKRDLSDPTDVQTDQADVASRRPHDGENDEVGEKAPVGKSSANVLDKTASSSSRSDGIHSSAQHHASVSNETSVSSRQVDDTGKSAKTNSQSLASEDRSHPGNCSREIKSDSDCATVTEIVPKPETSSALGTVSESVKNVEASGTLETEVRRTPNLDKLVDQRCESIPKKMKLELSPASSCPDHEQSITNLNSSPLIVRVKMIDFAHVLDAGGEPDSGYITGLNNLLQFMRSIV